MPDPIETAHRVVDRVKSALDDLVDGLAATLGRERQPEFILVPVRGRGSARAAVLVPRQTRRHYF